MAVSTAPPSELEFRRIRSMKSSAVLCRALHSFLLLLLSFCRHYSSWRLSADSATRSVSCMICCKSALLRAFCVSFAAVLRRASGSSRPFEEFAQLIEPTSLCSIDD